MPRKFMLRPRGLSTIGHGMGVWRLLGVMVQLYCSEPTDRSTTVLLWYSNNKTVLEVWCTLLVGLEKYGHMRALGGGMACYRVIPTSYEDLQSYPHITRGLTVLSPHHQRTHSVIPTSPEHNRVIPTSPED